MTELPNKLRMLLDETVRWRDQDFLDFNPAWNDPEKSNLKSVPEIAGVYALGLKTSIEYENKVSAAFYVGSSKNLRQRLRTHFSTPQNDVIQNLLDEFPNEFQFAFWPFENFPPKWLRSVEGELLWAFEETFGTVPVANLDIPETVFGAGRFGIAKADFESKSKQKNSISLQALANRLGKVLRFEELHPIGNPNQVSITFSFDQTGKLTTPGKYRTARLLDPEIVEYERKRELEHLSWITDEQVGAWDIEKFESLIAKCEQLSPVKSRAKTVTKFQSDAREVPTPHTWGEVALIKARIESGFWIPNEKDGRVWLKVVCGKELLGEAKLFEYMFQGMDKSDLPQRSTMRESYWDDYEPPEMPTYDDGEMIEVERIEGADEYTGETFLEVRSQATPDAVERLERAREDYDRDEREKLSTKIESTFLAALTRFRSKA